MKPLVRTLISFRNRASPNCLSLNPPRRRARHLFSFDKAAPRPLVYSSNFRSASRLCSSQSRM